MAPPPIIASVLIAFTFCAANVTAQGIYGRNITTAEKSATDSQHALMGMPSAAATLPDPLLRLKMLMDSINTDEIVIRLDNMASTKFVDSEDAEDIGGMGALVSLSAFSSDNVALAIDKIPYPGMQQQVVPLRTGAVNSGSYKLERTQLLFLPPLYEVWLKDAFTGDSLNLRSDSICRFNIDKNNPATFGSKRFSIVFRQNPDSALSLLSFVATKNSNSSLIGWKVKNESDSTTFFVERSLDTGKTFVSLGSVQSNGTGIYSFVDTKPATGQNQYRLEIKDNQNNSNYSPILTLVYPLQNAANSKIKLFPNPIVNNINLEMNSGSKASVYNIKIVNTLGAVVKESTSQQASWHTDLSNLRPGSYHVQVTNNSDQTLVGTANFIKN
ncbi:MAG: hypothetical protein JWQ66_1497 [Mucilaginibacter sp.]|nr:hypothetical protein [Mucilaginibacter sp.]